MRGIFAGRRRFGLALWTRRSSALHMSIRWQNHRQKVKLNLVCQFRVNSNLVPTVFWPFGQQDNSLFIKEGGNLKTITVITYSNQGIQIPARFLIHYLVVFN